MEQTVKVKFENAPTERQRFINKIDFIIDGNASMEKEMQRAGLISIFDTQSKLINNLTKQVKLITQRKDDIIEIQEKLIDCHKEQKVMFLDQEVMYKTKIERLENERN